MLSLFNRRPENESFLDVARNVYARLDAKVALLEAEPEISGTPWLDSLDAPVKR